MPTIRRYSLQQFLVKYDIRKPSLNILKTPSEVTRMHHVASRISIFFLNIKSRVKYDNLSESFSCFIGAPQGDCMSPFALLYLFLNDRNSTFSTFSTLIYLFCTKFPVWRETEWSKFQYAIVEFVKFDCKRVKHIHINSLRLNFILYISAN